MYYETFDQQAQEVNRWGFCPICGKCINFEDKYSAWPVFNGVCCEDCHLHIVPIIANSLYKARSQAKKTCDDVLERIERAINSSKAQECMIDGGEDDE